MRARHATVVALVVLAHILAGSAGAREETESLTVLASGETHGMLFPCDCPYRPEGGLARRATAVAQQRTGPHASVLVDAGGWAAGGIFDEYTEGAEVDAIRTEATARSMAAMGYGAVALSDEELACGPESIRRWRDELGLPLVSANLFDATTGERLAPAFVVPRQRPKVAVIGISPPELQALPTDVARRYRVAPPFEAARQAVRDAREKGAAAVIVLSPLGERMSERLAREVDGIDLVVNAGRRATTARHFRVGRVLVAQFDFQGRALVRSRLEVGPGPPRAHPMSAIVLGPDIADDPNVADIVTRELARIEGDGHRRVLLVELFKMAFCPYSPGLERTLAELVRSVAGRLDVRITHVVHVNAKGEFDSLHGQREVEEARRQAVIFRFYPEAYWDYAAWRAENAGEADWEAACRRLNIGVARVKGALATGEADEILRGQAYRVEHMRVSSSPALFLGGRRYEGGTGRLEVLRAVCSMLPGGTDDVRLCMGLPECFSDADCRRPGFVGKCQDPGTERAACIHHRAVSFEALVIEDKRAVYSPADRVLDSLRVFLPGIEERHISWNSPEGREIVARFEIEHLPAYVLERAALNERNIDAIREALLPAGDRLILAPSLAGSHQDITRPRMPGRVDLFLAPHSTVAAEALEEVLALDARGHAAHVNLRSAIRRDPEGKLAAQGGLAEVESMLREIAVASNWPDRFLGYLRARLEHVGSGYWRDPILESGLDPTAVRRMAEGDRALAFLDADAQQLAELRAGGPVVLLVANQEVVSVSSRVELRHALEAARSDSAGVVSGAGTRGKRAVPLLVRALEVVPQAARPRIARGLAALTEEGFGLDAERWKAYVREEAGPEK